MPYVERRNGAVAGLYANPQPGYAEEFLADDHPEVVAFTRPPTATEMDDRLLNAALVAEGSVFRAMAEVQFGMIKGTIAVTPTLTKAQYIAMLKARMR